jgi:integrase
MPLWKDPRTGKYRYQFQYQGKRYGRNGFDTQKAAKAAMAKHREELENPASLLMTSTKPGSVSDSDHLDLETLMVKHLLRVERDLVPATIAYRKAVFHRFIKKVGNLPAASITPDKVEEYLLTRPTNQNFNKERTELMTLFKWAFEREMIPRNPVARVQKAKKLDKPKKKIPTPQEMAKILMAAGKDRPLLLVLFHTMGRIGEILRLKWEDVNFEKKLIRLWTRKRQGGNWESDWLVMNEDLVKVLWDLWQKRTQEEWVFLSPLTGTRYVHRFTLIHNICERAGVPHYTYHCIRHFVASYLFDKKKVSLAVISKLLRHKNLQTTEIYLQAIDPRFRDTMRLLEGNVLSFLAEVEKPDGVTAMKG